MNRLAIIAVLATVVAISSGFVDVTNEEDLTARMLGANEIRIADAPYHAGLYAWDDNNKYYQWNSCSAVIISEKYVLTAAHCTFNIPADYFLIIFGSRTLLESDYDPKYQRHQGTAKYEHPLFNSSNILAPYDYNVAILSFKPIELNLERYTVAAHLPPADANLVIGSSLAVTGWGQTEDSGYSSNLRRVEIGVIDDVFCIVTYGLINWTPRMICAGNIGGQEHVCKGDAGGAVVDENNVVYGIVSHGCGCAHPNHPTVFTKLSDPNIREFILGVTGL